VLVRLNPTPEHPEILNPMVRGNKKNDKGEFFPCTGRGKISKNEKKSEKIFVYL